VLLFSPAGAAAGVPPRGSGAWSDRNTGNAPDKAATYTPPSGWNQCPRSVPRQTSPQ
jgi:hypothetical protein